MRINTPMVVVKVIQKVQSAYDVVDHSQNLNLLVEVSNDLSLMMREPIYFFVLVQLYVGDRLLQRTQHCSLLLETGV